MTWMPAQSSTSSDAHMSLLYGTYKQPKPGQCMILETRCPIRNNGGETILAMMTRCSFMFLFGTTTRIRTGTSVKTANFKYAGSTVPP